MKGNFQRVKARARSSKKQILILLEAKGGGLIPSYIRVINSRLSCEKYKMRKTRLIIILWGFVWPLEEDRKYCFVFEP